MRTTDVPGTTEPIDALEREITRIDRIMTGLGLGAANPLLRPRLRRATLPNPTVFDDNVVDDLVGDGDLDWFLSNVGDDIGPLDPGE